MLGPNFFNFLHFFFKKAGVCLCWRLCAFGFGGRHPLFRWRAVVGWLCPDAFRRRGRAKRLAISPFLYAISTLEKLFNLSASLCFSLSIRGKVAEGFDFQTFQNCSTLQRAGVWLVPPLSPPLLGGPLLVPPFGFSTPPIGFSVAGLFFPVPGGVGKHSSLNGAERFENQTLQPVLR